jgi:gliding motility-associated-like protein
LVTNAQNGCTAIASVDVLQNITPPVANAGATPTLTCAVTSLNLDGSGSSQGPTFSYKWSTTNGQIISGDVTTAPVIGHTGLYILTVTDQDNGCTAISQVTVVDDVVHPAAATAVAGELTCTVTSLPLSGAGSSVGNIFKYVWTTANGHIVSGDSTLSPVVNKAGKYTLLVTNTVNGCTSTSVVSVTRNITPPQVDAGADDQLTCSITQLSLAATASGGVNGVTYIWAGPGIVSGGTTPTPVINATGTYNLTVTDQYNGCTSVDNVHITPNTTAPTAIIAPPALLTCTVLTATINAGSSSTGAPFTYVWTGPGILSGANTLTPVVNQPGLYKLLITNTSNGCTTTASAQVDQNIILPTAKAGGAFELTCSIDHGFLDAAGSSTGSNFTYQWTTANGHIVDGAQTVKPKVDSVGTYLLVVLNTQTGCTSSAQVAVTRNTNYPSALKLSTDRPGCGGKTGTIQFDEVTGGVGPYVYSIDGGDHFASADTYKTLKPGTYHLVVQDVNGCEFEQSLNFPVPVEPKVTLPAEIHLAYGDPTTLTAAINIPLSQIDTIIWSPMDKLTLTAKPNVVNIRPFDDVQYTVRIVNLEGCHSEARVIVSVDDPNVWAPNVFSPNDDGVNDFFLIFAGEHTVKNIRTLQIYDRWGDQVFVAENILPNIEKVGWNGRMSGKSNAEAMTPAVFVWWAEVELESGRKILLKGDVTLVR